MNKEEIELLIRNNLLEIKKINNGDFGICGEQINTNRKAYLDGQLSILELLGYNVKSEVQAHE